MAQERANANPAASLFETVIELDEEVNAVVSGNIPSWLKGTLLRNGPGKFEFGDSSYNHWFDGQALLHRFTIEDGRVAYYNKFVRGKSFTLNTKKNCILFTEFGTNGQPDPCKNIFQRFFSLFDDQFTDNCLVNVIDLKDKLYAVSELAAMQQIHPETLDVLSTINITEEFQGEERLDSSLAHPHNEKNGTTYNLCTTHARISKLRIIVIPPKSAENIDEKPLEGGKILCSIPSHSSQAYFHSFGMTENYLIVMENPLLLNVPKILTHRLFGWNIADCFYWLPTQQSRFHIISKQTGEQVGKYTVEPTFVFHHVNAFETDTNIVIDVCGYDDASIIQELYLHDLRTKVGKRTETTCNPAEVRRYRIPLPLSNNLDPVEIKKNPDGKDYEVICQNVELPRVNYEHYNGKPYTFAYGLSSRDKMICDTLVKLNVNTKEKITWGDDESLFASEPVYVPCPGAIEEDDGVVLSVVIDVNNKKTFLLVLDGKTFKEVGRAEVPFITPLTVHGKFVEKQ